MKQRKLANGRAVAIHRNYGLRKRCECSRRVWATCSHPWHFSFKVKGGPHHRFPLDKYAEKPIRTKDDARDEADRLRILIRGGQFPPALPTPPPAPVTPADLTFETFGDKWVTNARSIQSLNQQMNDRGIVRRLSGLPLEGATLGQKAIGLLTIDDWETVFRQITGAASTRNKYRQAILTMQEWAVDKGYLPRPWLVGNVLQAKKGGIIGRRKGARRDRRLIPDVLDNHGKIKHSGEERRLMAKAGPWLQRLIVGALESGMRRGELMGLQWRDVSLPRRQITLRAEVTKTETMRQIAISDHLLAILKMLEHDPAGNPHKATAFVFGNAVGEQVKDPKKSWLKCCTAAGITDLHFHDLRHEAASRLLERGWPLSHVAKMLGHANTTTTSIYLNATITELQDSMTRFGTGGQSLHNLAHAPESAPPPDVQREESSAGNITVN